MAKQIPPKDDSNEIKKLLQNLYKAVQTLNSTSTSLVKNNRDLLKVMALLESGFAQSEEDAQNLIGEVKEGLEITDEFAKKWARSRKATKKDLDDIITKFRKLEEIDSDIIENAKDYLDLLDEKHDSLTSELDLTNNLLKSNRDILAAVRESKKAVSQLGSSVIDVNSATEQLVRKKVDLGNIFGDMFQSVDSAESLIENIQNDIQSLIANTSGSVIDLQLNFNPLTDDIDKEISNVMQSINLEKEARISALDDFFSKNRRLQSNLARQMASEMSNMKGVKIDLDTGNITKSGEELKRGTAEYQKVVSRLEKTINKNDIGSKVLDQFNEISSLMRLGTKQTEEQKRRLQELISPLDISTKLILEQFETHLKDLDTYEHGINIQKETHKILSENLHLLSSAESIVQKIGTGFDYLNAIMPLGIGDFLGLSKVSAALMDSHKKGVQSFVSALEAGEGKTAAMRNYMKELSPALKLALNPMTLLVAGGVLLFNMLSGIVDKYKEMSRDMRISILQSSQLLKVQHDILTSQKNQFATMQDIQDAQSEMIGSSGKVYDITDKGSKELAISLIETSKAFGYTVSEAVKLHKVFKNIGADDKLALQLEQNVGLMSEMAGLSPQIVSQDLLDSAETVSTYFAGMPEKAAKAAIQVRRMGLSLQTAGEIAKNMLNLEGFMTDMYELQSMSRGGIDFSGAFEKGLMGDIEGMTKDIMDNIGSTAELNRMDYLTRVKIAKTLGISVDDLAKSVRLREQMQGLGAQEQKYLDANLDRMGDISNLSKDEIRNRLQQLQSTDRLNVAWDKIKGTLVRALIPLAESFADAIDAISPLIDVIIGGLKFVGMLIKPLVPLVKGLLAPFKFVGDLISGIMSTFDDWFDPLTSITTPLDNTKTLLEGIGKVAYWVGAAFSTWFLGKKTLSMFGLVKSETNALGSTVDIAKGMFTSLFSGTASKSKESSKVISKTMGSALTNIAEEAATTSSKVQKESKKASNSGFVNPISAKGSFKLIGALAAATFAKTAVNGAAAFLNVRKEGEEQMSILSESSLSMFENLAMIGGPLLASSLQEGFERVFTKRIEKKFEGKFETSIGKISKRVGGLGDKIKGLFSGLFNPLSTNFDKFSGKVEGTKTTITDTVQTVKDVLPDKDIINPVKDISEETVSKKVKKEKVRLRASRPEKSKIVSGFDSIAQMLERSSGVIRKVLGDLTKIVSTSMKDISAGIGTSIKNLLKGIADGLNSFKTSALKGAASLVIVAGALWITSKSLKNFSEVKWEDIAKGLITLGGLVSISLLLGKSSGQMIVASIGIAALGAALIPAAFSLSKFNDIEWSSLGKAGVALVGLAVAGSTLGGLAPAMLLGAVGIAALGASIIPLAYSMKMFNDIEWSSLGKAGVAIVSFGVAAAAFGAISPFIIAGSIALAGASASIMTFSGSLQILSNSILNIDFDIIGELTSNLMKFNDISSIQILSISSALMTLSGALFALNSMSIVGSMSKMFGGDVLKDLERLGKLADPLYIIQNVIESLGSSITNLFDALSKLDFDQLSKFENVDVKSVDQIIQQKIQPLVQNSDIQAPMASSFRNEIGTVAKPAEPKRESVAQNIKVDPNILVKTKAEKPTQERKQETYDIYNRPGMETKKLEMLLMQANQLLELIASKNMTVELDGYQVSTRLKKFNNNKG